MTMSVVLFSLVAAADRRVGPRGRAVAERRPRRGLAAVHADRREPASTSCSGPSSSGPPSSSSTSAARWCWSSSASCSRRRGRSSGSGRSRPSGPSARSLAVALFALLVDAVAGGSATGRRRRRTAEPAAAGRPGRWALTFRRHRRPARHRTGRATCCRSRSCRPPARRADRGRVPGPGQAEADQPAPGRSRERPRADAVPGAVGVPVRLRRRSASRPSGTPSAS